MELKSLAGILPERLVVSLLEFLSYTIEEICMHVRNNTPSPKLIMGSYNLRGWKGP